MRLGCASVPRERTAWRVAGDVQAHETLICVMLMGFAAIERVFLTLIHRNARVSDDCWCGRQVIGQSRAVKGDHKLNKSRTETYECIEKTFTLHGLQIK